MTWTGEDSDRNRTIAELIALTFADSNGYKCKFLNKSRVESDLDEFGLIYELETI